MEKNKNRISREFCIWGQFDKKSTKVLNQIQLKVYKELQGPRFDIHLTLTGPTKDVSIEGYQKIRKVASEHRLIKLETNSYKTKNLFFQSLFIGIKQTHGLVELKKTLDEEYSKKSDIFFPHISLYYGMKEKKVKENMINTLPNLCKSFVLDKISLVKVDEDIERWDVIDQFMLLPVAK